MESPKFPSRFNDNYTGASQPQAAPEPAVLPAEPAAQADPLTRIAAVLEEIRGPLMAYFDDVLNLQEETGNIMPLDRAIATSPIAALLQDDSINDILINGAKEIYITRKDKLERTNLTFPDKRSLMTLARSIAHSAGRHIDPKRPLVDARLKDGSRVNIIAPPMAVSGLSMSIRKFPKQENTLDKLVEKREMTPQVADFLKLCAQNRISMLISGGTGTGKTTLLNAISHFIPETERIVTIEDTAELRLQQPHVVRLETKEPSRLGAREEEVNASDLVRNALRMRPDRIIVGEVRGEEAYDMIQALNTGHDGSLTTVHANTPRDALTRLENLLGPRMQNTPAASIRKQLVSAINILVQIGYAESDGRRVIQSVTEIVGMEGDTPTLQEIFKLVEIKTKDGKSDYTQQWTSIVPRHARLAEPFRAAFLSPEPAKGNLLNKLIG